MTDAVLAHAAAGRRVFPCQWAGPQRKTPLISDWPRRATADGATIARWWNRWPDALIGAPTGAAFVALDIDPRHGGYETLAALGFAKLPATPTVRTPSGGLHLHFAPPADMDISNTQGSRGRGIGAGLDWRGTGGFVILPAPGSGYEWIEGTATLPLAPVPAALLPRPGREAAGVGPAARCNALTPYGEAALRSAAEKILGAPNGEQEATLNGEAFAIGRLAGAGGVPVELALDVLLTSARAIPSYDRANPWRPAQVERKVRGAFAAGLARPRPDAREAERELDRVFAEARDV